MPVPLTGQVAVSGTAQQLDAGNTANDCKAFTIKAPITNALGVRIGSATVAAATGHVLDPGDELTYERLSQSGQPRFECKPNDFWVVGTSPDVVSWLASP